MEATRTKTMKKTFKLLGVLLIAALSFSVAACGSDDEPSGGSTDESTINLAGTKWKVVSDEGGAAMEGCEITFWKDGIVKADPSFGFNNMTWTKTGDNLKVFFDQEEYMVGPFIVNGKKATYTYHFGHGDWEFTDEPHEMILKRL